MMRGSNAGHKSPNAVTTVAMVIALSVVLDGRLLVRQLWCHTKIQATDFPSIVDPGQFIAFVSQQAVSR